MGGCRCAFRDCPVGTSQHPGMHFFHFPINDRVRYARWLSLANTKHFLEMPRSFQRNRVVCARHFRDEYFKNYKRDGILSNKAEPTLLRLNEDTALDYANEAENGGPELIKIPICTVKHLIPPPSYTLPFSLHDNLKPREYIKKKNITLGKSRVDCSMGKSNDERGLQSEKRNRDETSETEKSNNAKKFKILNSEAMSTSSNSSEITSPDTIIKINFDGCDSMLEIPLSLDENSLLEENSVLEEVYEGRECDDNYDLVQLGNCIDEATVDFANDNLLLKQQCEELTKQLQSKDADHEKETEELSLRVQELERELEKSKKEIKIKGNALQRNQIELEKVNAQLKCVLPYYEELDVNYKILKELNETTTKENRRLAQENCQLRDKCVEYEKQRKLKEIGEVTTSQATSSVAAETVNVSSRQPTAVANSTPNSLSKAQLFNGVKKYISSSMVAFLRMEMFGNAEREWKPDERRVAMNLIQLGDEVYNYVSDEWRFRLPALGEARSWLADTTNSIDDEEEL